MCNTCSFQNYCKFQEKIETIDMVLKKESHGMIHLSVRCEMRDNFLGCKKRNEELKDE